MELKENAGQEVGGGGSSRWVLDHEEKRLGKRIGLPEPVSRS